MIRAFCEAPAGLASVSLRLHGGAHCRPPISRMGNKAGYAEVILAALGLRSGEGAGAYVWAESDPDVRALLRAYPDADMLRRIADIIRGWKDEEPRALWERLRAERKARGPAVEPDVAGFCWLQARSVLQKGPSAGYMPGGDEDGSGRWVPTQEGIGDACHRLAEYAQLLASNRLIPGATSKDGRWVNAARDGGPHTDGGASFGGEAFATPAAEVAGGFERVAEWALLATWSYRKGEPESGFNAAALRDREPTETGGNGAKARTCEQEAGGFERVAGWMWEQGHASPDGRLAAQYLNPDGNEDGSWKAPPRDWLPRRCDRLASRWPPVAVLATLPTAAELSAMLGTPGDLEGVIIYGDADYRDTTGYADTCREMMPDLARGWDAAGAVVCLSEAEPYPELPTWHTCEITGGRRGQKRTFSKQQHEWLTMNREPAHRVAEQVRMFGG